MLACWIGYFLFVDFLAVDFFAEDFFAEDFFAEDFFAAFFTVDFFAVDLRATVFLAEAFFAAFFVAFLTANCFPLEGFALRCFFAAFFADFFTAALAETFRVLLFEAAFARFFDTGLEAVVLLRRFALTFFLGGADFFFATGFEADFFFEVRIVAAGALPLPEAAEVTAGKRSGAAS